MGTKMMLWAALIFWSLGLPGCQSVTTRINRRAESHVQYEASRYLDCPEKQLSIQCTDTFKSGECVTYTVRGCNRIAAYQNLPAGGWSQGE